MIYCEIIDRGELFSTHIDKAIELGADIDRDPYNKESKHKWVFNQGINNNDLCILLCKINYFCLVERIKDNRQFVISADEIKITAPILEDDLFEI